MTLERMNNKEILEAQEKLRTIFSTNIYKFTSNNLKEEVLATIFALIKLMTADRVKVGAVTTAVQIKQERKQHIFGYHKSHSEVIKNRDSDELDEVLIQEEEGKIEALQIQDDQVNQSMDQERFKIEPADDLVEQPKLNKSVSMFSPRDQKWQCFKCNMINTLQNSRCIRCKGEFMKNFLQIKDDVKNFIERIRKEQLKEQQKLHRESQEKLRKSQIAQSGGGGNANKHKDSDECRIF